MKVTKSDWTHLSRTRIPIAKAQKYVGRLKTIMWLWPWKKKEKYISLKWCPLTYRASGFLIMMHWTHLHSVCTPRPCTKWFFFPVQPQTLHADEIPPIWTVVTQSDLLFHNRLFWIPVISNSNPFTLVIWLYQLSWKCKLATVTSWTNLHGQIPKEEKFGQFTFST